MIYTVNESYDVFSKKKQKYSIGRRKQTTTTLAKVIEKILVGYIF